MTNDEPSEEASEELVEDLDAPAAAQRDVVGGRCLENTHRECVGATCDLSEFKCSPNSDVVVVRNA
jgi:hypothetical protein